MERNLQFQPVFAGGEVYGDGGVSQEMSIDETYINGMLSFQSLLNSTEPPLYDVCYYPMPELAPEFPTPMTYSLIGETFQAETENSDIIHQKLEMPKLETEPFNFLTETTTQFLPSLNSFTESASNSAMQSLQFETGSDRRPYKISPSPSAARRRTQTISKKMRCLEKLLPCEKKMDTATMLEEAYKYVKFLKAQVSVLESMPHDSTATYAASCSSLDAASSSAEATLKSLNRQQLLETVVNSRVAQTLFSSKELCLFSTEQLPLIYNNIAQTRLLLPWRSI